MKRWLKSVCMCVVFVGCLTKYSNVDFETNKHGFQQTGDKRKTKDIEKSTKNDKQRKKLKIEYALQAQSTTCVTKQIYTVIKVEKKHIQGM